MIDKFSNRLIISNSLTTAVDKTPVLSACSPYKNVAAVRTGIVSHTIRYPCSSVLGSTWSFGFLLIVFIVLQVLSGIALSMYYVADIDKAFYTVHAYIYRCVPNGWLFMYMHSNGATMIFALLYAHIARGIYYRAFTRVGM
jgi:quinol-cytochrome oxidoreductase complex cytochrome b subunit